MVPSRGIGIVIFAMSVQLVCTVSAQQEVDSDEAVSKSAQRLAERRIEAALAQVVTLEGNEITLEELVEFLNDSGLPCQLDRRALDDDGLTPSARCSVPPRGLTLRATLGAMLDGLGLTWAIKHERLLITTQEEGETIIKTRAYDVRLLVERVTYPPGSMERVYDFDTLIDLIIANIAPNTWDDVGGEGSIGGSELNGVPLLVISQTDHVLRDVEALFSELKAKSGVGRFARRLARSSLPSSRSIPIGGQRLTRPHIRAKPERTVPAPSWATPTTYE